MADIQQKTIIRLYEDEGNSLSFNRSEFDLSEFGGHLPIVGDLIIDPGVVQGLDRNEPTNRTIFEVTARYFAPGSRDDGYTYVCFVVKPRAGTDKEADIL